MMKRKIIVSPLRCLILFSSFVLLSPVAFAQTQPFTIKSMKAQLFYEDKGTFSEDAADDDTGPPYVPPRFWNTPMQYEKRSSSVLVIVEVTGDPMRTPVPQLEFIARYLPWDRARKPVVVRRLVSVDIPIKGKERDNYYAGFWLYETGCNPVRLTARIVGRNEKSIVKKVIRFGCGE